jgi:hypothetical protein
MTYWWVLPDQLNYKTPVDEGKALIPQEFLKPDFVPDTAELWYSFEHNGRRDPRVIGDFSGWDDSAFFVNEKGYRIFEDMFTKHGRPYRVRCDSQPHYMVLIDTLHDAIDLQRSKFERFNFSERVEDDIRQFRKIVLKDGFKTDADIFRLDGSYALRRLMIVSNRFKQRYLECGLTGLFFKSTDGGG